MVPEFEAKYQEIYKNKLNQSCQTKNFKNEFLKIVVVEF